MKLLVRILLILAVVAAALLVAKNAIAKTLVVQGVKMITGLSVGVGAMDIGAFNTSVGVTKLVVKNPAGFPDPIMIDMPELFVDYELAPLLKGKAHLTAVRLNLRELVVVRNQRGELNLNALRAVQESKAEAGKAPPPDKPAKAPEVRIDTLDLKIGQVVYKDYSAGGEPKVQTFPINVDKQYAGITNPYALGGLIVSEALMRTSIARLTGFDLGAVQSLVTQELGQAAQGLLKDATGQAAGVVNEAAGSLKKLFGN